MAWEDHLVFSSFLLHFTRETMKFDPTNWFLNWRLGSFEYLSIQFFLNCLVKFLLCLVISKFWWRLLLLGFLILLWRSRRRSLSLALALNMCRRWRRRWTLTWIPVNYMTHAVLCHCSW
jgi:hypothetical protein